MQFLGPQLSGDTITASFAGTTDAQIEVFAISGANASSPFDSNINLPNVNSGTSTSPSTTISTSNANDILILSLASSQKSGSATVTDPSGFTNIQKGVSCDGGGYCVLSDSNYKVVSSTQSSVTEVWTLSASRPWAAIGDAVKAAVATSNTVKSTVLYYYDKASNIVALNYPDGYNLSYSYDALNRVANVGNGYSAFKYTSRQSDKIDYLREWRCHYLQLRQEGQANEHPDNERCFARARANSTSDYKPFGPQYSSSGSGINFRYTGKLIDTSTGLYHFGARYYDPASGRFITQDSDTGSSSDPRV